MIKIVKMYFGWVQFTRLHGHSNALFFSSYIPLLAT